VGDIFRSVGVRGVDDPLERALDDEAFSPKHREGR
jgi:hypothetical protein